MGKKIYILFIFILLADGLLGQKLIKGVVKDKQTQDVMIGATILETGTDNGTVTNIEGSFEIFVSNSNGSLTVSMLDFEMIVPINGQDYITIEVGTDAQILQEVVVVGYGVQKKSDVTSAISSIKGKDVEKITVPNIEQALQGKVSGVYVAPSSGNPGARAVIRIRGTGTLNNANPLFVIDGMITYDASLVNPQEVESIEVLKDAAAAAIYGSRGANGVIIVTTKNGKNKKVAQVGISSYYGLQSVTKQIAMLDGQQFANAYNKLRGQSFYPDPSIFGAGTNYQSEIFRSAPMHNTQLSATGGNAKYTYHIGANYFNQEGILRNTNFTRGTFRINIQTALSPWLTFGSNTAFASSTNQNGPNVVGSAYRMPPIYAPLDSSGKYSDPTFFGLAIANPIADQFYKSNNHSSNKRLFGNLFFEASILKNLKFKSNFGYDNGSGKSKYFEPKFEVSGSQRNIIDRLSVGFNEGNNWIWEQTMTYTTSFNKDHSLNLLLGYTAEERASEWLGGSRENFPGTIDDLLYLSSGNDTTQMNYGGAVDEALVSQLFRVNYSMKNKYFITASLRRDQSSRFTQENRTGYFPSASVGWNLGSEPFISRLNLFTDLKVRLSYGILGNQASASTYPAAGVVNSGLYAIFGPNETLTTGATLLSLTNPNLHWETSKQTDIGVDGSILDGRLSFEFDLYNRLTSDIISSVPIPAYVGSEGDPIVNSAKVKNDGVDLSLKYQHQIGKFNIAIGGNFSPVRNKVVALSQGKTEVFAAFLQGEPASRTVLGLPIGSFYGYQVEGIFQSKEEISSSPNFGLEQPGDYKFKDIDGNGILNSKDRTYLGSPIPKLTYGFNTSIDWLGFDLNVDVLVVKGNKVFNSKESFRFGVYNWEQHVADAWTKEKPSSTEPRVTYGGHNYRVSDRYLHDGSFIRLRNVTLGYSIASSLLKKVKLTQFRLYATANNIWTKQKYTGYSPEFPNGSSPFEVGFDAGSYPIAKSINFGIDLKF